METYRFVLPFTRPYRGRYLAGIAAIPLSAALTLAIPWLTGECVRLLDVGASGQEALLWRLVGLAALAIGSGASLFAIRWLIIGASRKVEHDLRNHLFRHVQGLDLAHDHRARTGDVMSRITSDVDRTRLLVGPIIMYSARTLLMLAIGLPLMVSVSLLLTLMVMVPLSLITLAVRVIGPRVHREVFRAQEALADLSSQAQEDFAGIRVVKSFAREREESERFGDLARRYMVRNLRTVRVSAWMMPVIGAVGDLALISLLLIGGALILRGEIDYGGFVKFAGYQIALLWPMLSIGWVVNQYHRAKASVERLRGLLDQRPRVTDPASPAALPGDRVEGNLSIRGLTFAYADRPVLVDVCLEAPRGSTVALIGRTGSGKSTLVQLIPRILSPPDGTVFVDGVDVNRLDLGQLRRSIGYVPQEAFLFSRTIGENITFARDEAEGSEVEWVAGLARLDKDVDQFPHGYNEIVGERGVTLSGGQKQRATLARALMVRPRLLLLDDAFSSIDTETEREILLNLRRETEGITTLIVSHRISSIAHADRIYVLDEGRVAERGSHTELLTKGGIYAEIHHLQELSDELDHL